jgi:excisionase family DNA binding protein
MEQSRSQVPEHEADNDTLTVDEAAEVLRVGRTQLYDAIGRGEVPHRRVGRSIRLSRSALAAWLATGGAA